MQPLDIHEMCGRVGVHPPYFSFIELHGKGRGAVEGRFIPEHRTGRERGPVAAAELVRHLANLGACAAALERDPGRTYYLGTKGQLRFMRGRKDLGYDGTLQARSEVVRRDKRSLRCHSIVFGGDVLAHMSCDYQILPEAVFARTFKHYRVQERQQAKGSPYTDPIQVEFDEPYERSLTAHSRPLPPGRFAGHFFDYPAWPASIYAETIARMVDRLLHQIVGKEVEYSVARIDMEVFRLISASDAVSFRVDCIHASDALSYYVFSGLVRCGQTTAATMEMEVHL